MIISVPSSDGLRSHTRLRNLGHEDPGNPEYHYRVGYGREDLTQLLSKYGVRITRSAYSLILTSELIMDAVKWFYFRKNTLESQANIHGATRSPLFRIYRALFPGILWAEYLERVLLSRWLRGHILNMVGIVTKRN
ncbi:MAG: hypothetical protein JW821_16500, partial [Deltaproteobacteria bacterium]|nr:hypothetical protein [Deltaproteobacteria bacterium]